MRYLAFRNHYGPMQVVAGSLYAETSVVVVFKLNQDHAKKYEEWIHWQKVLTNPVEVMVD